MDFNDRVLRCATDPSIPLLERLNFLSITAANLDEFFQVRIAALSAEEAGSVTSAKRNDLVFALLARSQEFTSVQYQVFTTLMNELETHGIRIATVDTLNTEQKLWANEYFDERVYPVLTPLAVDPAHPFPWISSLSINLAFILREPKTGVQRFARVKIPTNLERLIQVPNTNTFIPLEAIVQHYWDRLFPGMDLESDFVFRVTRSSQYKLDEENDLLEAMNTVVRRRQRFGQSMRLEIQEGIDNSWAEMIQNEVALDSSRIFSIKGLLDLADLAHIAQLNFPALRYTPWKPKLPARLNKVPATRTDLFSILRDRDLLIHRPYESYEETVEALVYQAAQDPDVLAIKQTLYRAAGVNSPIVQALCHAAENGKQVVALVELKARFDEQTNIERAKKLERSGVHILYGKVGLKTHAKLLHIVREEGEGIRYYSHISTGNYNPSTAGVYEDFDLFTSDGRIGRDVGDLFNDLTGYTSIDNYREILVAPQNMRERLLELFDEQACPGGSIIIKCNNIVDHAILSALCDAADEGAEVKVIVRASCGFTPESIAAHPRISVKSVIGRFLEHSRVYRFGDGDGAKLYIGSADLMVRNLDHRVEVLVPLYQEHTRRYINEALTELLDDENEHWRLTSSGWVHMPRFTTAHQSLMDIAVYRADTQRKLSDAQRNMPETRMDEIGDSSEE